MAKQVLYRAVLAEGVAKGWRGTVWILKILVPISLVTFLLDASGVLARWDHLLAPLMSLFQLPPTAALPLMVGLLTGIYGAVAAMSVLNFSLSQSILIAVFLLIAHALPQESLVQARSGMRFGRATFVRLAAAVLVTLGLAHVIPAEAAPTMMVAAAADGSAPFAAQLTAWIGDTLWLGIKILVIITAMMLLLTWLQAMDCMAVLANALNPVLRLMGLDRRVGVLWLTAAVFGLSYGAAVIVEESRQQQFRTADIRRLHLSIGINHAMLEDPLLFMAMGLPAVWLWLPRLAAAIVVVYIDHIWCRLRSRPRPRLSTLPGGKPPSG